MALTGNLGFVPLDEILRLLARSGQKGSVAVRGDNVRGRIFVTTKGVTLATTTDDASLRQRLINSGYVDEAYLRNAASRDTALDQAADSDSGIIDLLREISVESIYLMTRFGDSFEVEENAESPYASPKAFDLEEILEGARQRAEEWNEVSKVLSNLEGLIRMNRDLGERFEVTLSRDAWQVLSELNGGASVSEMAARLGTTEFWTARVAADMAERDLLIVPDQVEQPAEPETAEWVEAPEVPAAFEAVDTAADEDVVEAPAGQVDADVDPNESWWVEPDQGASDEVGEAAEESEAAEDQPARLLGAFAQRRNGFDTDVEDETPAVSGFEDHTAETVEEDTEAFLEKVFSELEAAEAGDEDTEGHGLLRRRRIGTFSDREDD